MPSAFLDKVPREEEQAHVNWRQKLKHITMKVTGRMESGGLDFSMAMPSKSSYARGIPRPGMVQMQPEVAFIIDTSGSMGTRQIMDGIREIIGVMKSAGIDEAWFLEADAGVAAKPKRIRMRSLMRDLDIHGRGGTDFDPGLRACMKLKPRPDIVFYITDGDGYVTFKPSIPVVWVVVKSYYNKRPAKWGYTVPNVADWNHDGLPDIVINSIWGEILWYENNGTRTAPALKPAQPLRVAWQGPTPKPAWVWWTPKGDQLVTQWRTSPLVVDWNGDGLNDLVMLDHEGYLAFFERRKVNDETILLPGKRIFLDEEGHELHLNDGRAGKSGRRKLALADWDGDGITDILINGDSVDFLRNVGTMAEPKFQNLGSLDARPIGGHSTCPTTVDWDHNGVPDLLYGAEDGFFYYLPNSRPPR